MAIPDLIVLVFAVSMYFALLVSEARSGKLEKARL
jgi:hypothetical protein